MVASFSVCLEYYVIFFNGPTSPREARIVSVYISLTLRDIVTNRRVGRREW